MEVKEVWRWIEGYEGHYAVSNLGRIASHKKNKVTLLTPYKHSKGYLKVGLSLNNVRKHYAVHRLVGNAFIPNPENKPQINHKFGNKEDNRASELEWTTNKENCIHAHTTGLCNHDNYGLSGKLNPMFSSIVYHFYHSDYGEFVGTQYDFYTNFNLDRTGVGHLIKGKNKTCKGWRLMSH